MLSTPPPLHTLPHVVSSNTKQNNWTAAIHAKDMERFFEKKRNVQSNCFNGLCRRVDFDILFKWSQQRKLKLCYMLFKLIC